MHKDTVVEKIKQTHGHIDTDLRENVPNRKPYFGIKYPVLKQIAHEIKQSDPIEFLDSNDFSIYELEIIHTIVLGNIKEFHVAVHYFENYMPHAREWSVVDSLCQRFVIAKKHPKEVFSLLIHYAKLDHEYIQRMVAVMILSHFLVDAYIDDSIQLLSELRNPGYFTKMAVAWAFASIMAKYPCKCMDFMQLASLDTWTHNKAIQKMIESYRISENEKEKLKKLRR
ncbi:MAG: DNA alkylation repair protein [Acholeplasmataceae bacterium]|nr:DNA alkylation repair protein [Acholeplasmataceae bacterium]